MPSNTRGSGADDVTVVCTSQGGGASTLTPIDQHLFVGSTIVFNGNIGFQVGRSYQFRIEVKS